MDVIYKVNTFMLDFFKIKEYEYDKDKSTVKTIFLRGCRVSRTTNGGRYFDTFEEALEFANECYINRLVELNRHIERTSKGVAMLDGVTTYDEYARSIIRVTRSSIKTVH